MSLRAPSARDAGDYECPPTPTRVRLVRVLTPKGRVQGVMTSLLDSVAFPAAIFGALYHGRWRIEETFQQELAERFGTGTRQRMLRI